VEAACQRSDLLERHRELMRAWADYASGKARVLKLAGAA